jgi:NTE family protein
LTIRHRKNVFVTALVAALLSACASPLPREQPLRETVKVSAPKLAPGVRENSDELFVVVTFSGGGKRASAFSFGVLEALRDISVTVPGGARRPLLDEIDIISAVSGGAFTAAYYALHGYDTFEQFPTRFLEHDTAAAIRRVLFSPANWPRLMTSKVSRSDLAAEYLDREIFDHATVADLIGRSPRVIVTATDLVRAAPFAFTREQMNGVCMDPASVPLARAVFASADTPIYFAPLVMRNFAGRCDYRPPASANLGNIREDEYYRVERARRLASFLDSKNYPYLHLADGALTDNLGARAFLDEVNLGDDVTDALRRNGFSRATRMLFIVVDARTGFDQQYAKQSEPLGIQNVLDAVTSVTFNRYSFETINLLRARVGRWERQVRDARCGNRLMAPDGSAIEPGADCAKFEVELVELAFDQLQDAAEREYLDRIPTTATLPPADVARLRRAAQQLVTESADLKRFLSGGAAK